MAGKVRHIPAPRYKKPYDYPYEIKKLLYELRKDLIVVGSYSQSDELKDIDLLFDYTDPVTVCKRIAPLAHRRTRWSFTILFEDLPALDFVSLHGGAYYWNCSWFWGDLGLRHAYPQHCGKYPDGEYPHKKEFEWTTEKLGLSVTRSGSKVSRWRSCESVQRKSERTT